MNKIFTAMIPYPPTVNTYWRFIATNSNQRRVLLSKKAREYKNKVALAVRRPEKPMTGNLSVSMLSFPPDKRRRDFDNILKGTFDALQHAGVYEDDSQIVEFYYKKATIIKGGQLMIEIKKANDN